MTCEAMRRFSEKKTEQQPESRGGESGQRKALQEAVGEDEKKAENQRDTQAGDCVPLHLDRDERTDQPQKATKSTRRRLTLRIVVMRT